MVGHKSAGKLLLAPPVRSVVDEHSKEWELAKKGMIDRGGVLRYHTPVTLLLVASSSFDVRASPPAMLALAPAPPARLLNLKDQMPGIGDSTLRDIELNEQPAPPNEVAVWGSWQGGKRDKPLSDCGCLRKSRRRLNTKYISCLGPYLGKFVRTADMKYECFS